MSVFSTLPVISVKISMAMGECMMQGDDCRSGDGDDAVVGRGSLVH